VASNFAIACIFVVKWASLSGRCEESRGEDIVLVEGLYFIDRD